MDERETISLSLFSSGLEVSCSSTESESIHICAREKQREREKSEIERVEGNSKFSTPILLATEIS